MKKILIGIGLGIVIFLLIILGSLWILVGKYGLPQWILGKYSESGFPQWFPEWLLRKYEDPAMTIWDFLLMRRIDKKNVKGETIDPRECESFTSLLFRNRCLMIAASSRKDPSLCWKMTPLSQKDYRTNIEPSDIYTCLSFVAVEKKDPEVCRTIEKIRRRDHCFRLVAFFMENPKICEKITSPSIKEDCLRKSKLTN